MTRGANGLSLVLKAGPQTIRVDMKVAKMVMNGKGG